MIFISTPSFLPCLLHIVLVISYITKSWLCGFRFLEDGDTLTEEITEVDSDDDDEEDEEEEEDSTELDDDGWITPSNVNTVNLHMTGVDTTPSVSEAKKKCVVGCLTTDFAMQVKISISTAM